MQRPGEQKVDFSLSDVVIKKLLCIVRFEHNRNRCQVFVPGWHSGKRCGVSEYFPTETVGWRKKRLPIQRMLRQREKKSLRLLAGKRYTDGKDSSLIPRLLL